ncbi:glutamate-cysteine ligase family protein [Lacimicrobium alkaliphilum]|uniref:Glutamate--cysteine ligase n=1 Tax=Lacimicrobium alkaliphilum TaxID=1526571 RepID=A0ABQ1QZ68_9ALTE|nr:glutamate-cysteine ligase family protein [Lacimicrobium alkaliphilum]GGD52543.1 hypothetical protein GCM10011357_05500 [Lacimicrobium alkaliphilum]
MGQSLSKDHFSPADHTEYRQRIQQQLTELKPILEQPGFSDGPASIGAELELYITDNNGFPAPLNEALLQAMQHPLLTEELNRFNLEINLSPVAARGQPFKAMEAELQPIIKELRQHAKAHQGDIISIGILPTLNSTHLQRDYMTDRPRYRALTKELTALKGEPFLVDINGQDSLKMRCDEVTLEGANTSFQVHLKVPGESFARYYNAAQLVTPLVLAVSGNSPTFLGQRLWQETRIALFKQSIDSRNPQLTEWRQPARVTFGRGWVRKGAWELFAENVALYRPLMPYLSPDNSPFFELSLHHGTVWSWNRPVFEYKNGGHLRIEYRALPAGPTVIDMMANAALAIGLTTALAEDIEGLLARLPFPYAEFNFYRAAQKGLSTNVLWPTNNQHSLRESAVVDVLRFLLPEAARGLAKLGVAAEESNRLLTVIEKRLDTGITGSSWQLKRLEQHLESCDQQKALHRMLEDYQRLSLSGEAVANWSLSP